MLYPIYLREPQSRLNVNSFRRVFCLVINSVLSYSVFTVMIAKTIQYHTVVMSRIRSSLSFDAISTFGSGTLSAKIHYSLSNSHIFNFFQAHPLLLCGCSVTSDSFVNFSHKEFPIRRVFTVSSPIYFPWYTLSANG